MMDKSKTVVFIGHSDCPLTAEQLTQYIEKEILSGAQVFLSGGQGAFDRAAARTVFQLKQQYPTIRNILVVPYHKFKVFDKALFDEIITADTSNSESYTGYRAAIPKRNKYLVDHAAAAICYITHISGGAYNTFQLAEKAGLRVINLGAFV